jgi:hypothetical protein
MKFHATLHENDKEQVFERHVIADDTGQAREKIKAYLQRHARSDLLTAQIHLVAVGGGLEPSLPLVE